AVTAMTRKLRENRDSVGLLFANGGFVTKQHSLVVATRPPAKPLASGYDVQADADKRRGKVPQVEETFVGPGKLETYTVIYDRQGAPEYAVVFARNEKGSRVVARVGAENASTLSFLTASKPDAIGTDGATSLDKDGLLHWTL